MCFLEGFVNSSCIEARDMVYCFYQHERNCKMLTFNSGIYKRIEIFPALPADGVSVIRLISDTEEKCANAQNHTRLSFPLEMHTDYAVSLESALMYLTDAEELFEKGVRFLGGEKSTRRFAPRAGLFKAPAAFCKYNEYYHMFYRCDLFSDDRFYLCHAVSRDLLSWHHLPVSISPPLEMCQSGYRAGGVLAADIEVKEGGAVLSVTQGIFARESGEALRIYQVAYESRDMLHFTEASMLSCAAEKTQNTESFPIGRTYAELEVTAHGTIWRTGTAREGSFRCRHRGILDFGGDFEVPKSFSVEGRRILFGKIGKSLSLPREITVRAGALRVLPAREIYEAMGDAIYEGDRENICIRPNVPVYGVEMTLEGKTNCRVQAGDALFSYENGICTLGENEYRTERVERLLFLVSEDAVEVFINGGETAGTVRRNGAGFLKASFSAPEAVSGFTVRPIVLPRLSDMDYTFPIGETFEF